MLSQLYEQFRHWSNNGNIWLYSDPHFNDEDCSKIDPNWPTSDEQIKLINAKAKRNDTLIILGDIGDISCIPKLKAGYKILIAGNHDKGLSNYKKKIIYRAYDRKEYENISILREELKKEFPLADISIWESYDFHLPFIRYNVKIDNKMFDEVYGGPLFISDKILLSHEPIYLDFIFNIHGHCHNGAGKQGNNMYDLNHYNVCSNTIEYTPICLDTLIKEGCLKYINNIHRVTINSINK